MLIYVVYVCVYVYMCLHAYVFGKNNGFLPYL